MGIYVSSTINDLMTRPFAWRPPCSKRRKKRCQMACKPGSVSCWKMIIHLGQCLRITSSNQPGQAGLKTGPRARRPLSLFGFAPGGACHAINIAADAVRSYRTFSPLPVETGGSLSVALSLGSRRPGVTRHLVSMEPGLSSTLPPRPSGHLTIRHVGFQAQKVKQRTVTALPGLVFTVPVLSGKSGLCLCHSGNSYQHGTEKPLKKQVYSMGYEKIYPVT